MTTEQLIDQTPSDPSKAPAANPGAATPSLFYLPGATEGTQQWKAETFQLVNWGGFESRVEFAFHPGATLISGASGTGKSTLLDAYIALMMPADTPFNGASNDSVVGRARGTEQRNLLSYLRGQTDTTADETGREKPKLLRGDGRATWGAVSMTFINDAGQRFTALRVYHVRAAAVRTGDITMRMATLDRALDLAELEPLAADLFAPKTLKAAFPGMHTHETYQQFSTRLHTRLGIGANGDGAKALRLLVRIQSGHQIRTVDALYKEMVLERPATFEHADRAISHFDDLEAAYTAMATEQAKADLLGPITARHAELLEAHTTIDTIDTYGLSATGPAPIQMWALRTEQRILDEASETNREARRTSTDTLRDAESRVGDLSRELEAAKDQHREAGGGKLELLANELAAERTRLEDRTNRRHALTEKTMVLGSPLHDPATFTRLQTDAGTFLATHPHTDQDLLDQREALGRQQVPLLDRKRELTAERASLSGRAGRVPMHLDNMRREVCQATGLAPERLPFLAELIDVKPEQARWRTAIETVLFSAARLMLVPQDEFARFSAAIDPLRLRGRLTFQGAALGLPERKEPDQDRVAGKLEHRESPFRGWVQNHLAAETRNLRCVESARDLEGPDPRVTLTGQTRHGLRGAHGRNDAKDIIGFSNEQALADIDSELAGIETVLAELDRARGGIDDQRTTLSARRRAYEAVQDQTWADIDVAACETRIRELEATRARILNADDRLQALATHIESLTEQLDDARGRQFKLKEQRSALAAEHTAIVERQDEVTDAVDDLDQAGITLDDTQTRHLDREFAAAVAPGDPNSWPLFGENCARLRTRLDEALGIARSAAARASETLEGIFRQYKERWDSPNLGASVASYLDYQEILDNILSTGLHQRRAEWRRRLTTWSGEDLVPLAGAMESCVEDIEERLVPINSILGELPFGANRDRLQIKLRRLAPDNVSRFRRDLRDLSSAATKAHTDEQLEHRFRDLQQFMARLRKRDDPRAIPDLSDRERLLDVRWHVEVTAQRFSPTGELLSTHASLGGKSGGETQELVAFIVGAALRFRLGDELRTRPRFAPVFLDEGFIKSDAEFAGRAVEAWKHLGFQLIVGVPLDKVTALEPHMNEMLAITKNTTTGYSFIGRLTDTRPLDTVSPGADTSEQPESRSGEQRGRHVRDASLP